MSDITINNGGSQDDNQKTTLVKESSFELNDRNGIPANEIYHSWLGWRGSNPRMHGPKPCALPLGDTPIMLTYTSIYEWQNLAHERLI